MKVMNNLNDIDKKHLYIASSFYVMEELSTVSMVVVILDMMNMAFSGSRYFCQLYQYWICLGALLLLKTLSNSKAELEKHYAGYSVTERIRSEMIRKLKQFSLGFYSKERLGEIESVIRKDVDTVEIVAAHVWSKMFGEFALTVAVGFLLGYVNVEMFILMLSPLPLGVYFLTSGLKDNMKKDEEIRPR